MLLTEFINSDSMPTLVQEFQANFFLEKAKLYNRFIQFVLQQREDRKVWNKMVDDLM